MNPAHAVTLGLSLMLVHPASSEPAEGPGNSAAFSRDKILPLVTKPGKEKSIFSAFEPGKRVAWNKDFWGASLGFEAYTGMGWHHPQVGTLVTPEHIVGAAHYGVQAKGVDFYGIDGSYLGNRKPTRREDGKIDNVKIQPDVLVLRLESPAPEGAVVCSLPDPRTYAQRRAWGQLPTGDRPLLVATDWRNPKPRPAVKEGEKPPPQKWRTTRTAHPVLFRSITESSRTLQWSYGPGGDPKVDRTYHEMVNKGDSSNPIFWVTRSGLVLASTFSGTTTGPDYGNPQLQKELQEAIDKLGGTGPTRLRFAPVP